MTENGFDADRADLRGYAERLLDRTGIDIDQAVDAGGDTLAAKALSAGWRSAADPLPALPLAPYAEDQDGGERA